MNENIELITHSAIKIKSNDGKIIYFDPFNLDEEYRDNADFIFITHSHYDHFSPEDIEKIKNDKTKIIVPEEMIDELNKLDFYEEQIFKVRPNENYEIDGIEFNTVPAYNINKEFHKKEYNWVRIYCKNR